MKAFSRWIPSPSRPLEERVSMAAIILMLGGLLALSWIRLQPPPGLGLDTHPSRFSAARAQHHVEMIAQKPHFLGSPEHDRVRDYLLDALRSLGLETELQAATSTCHLGLGEPIHLVGRVENLIARMPGTNSSNTLLLSAHYDSGCASPGASDNGAAVGALLEVARVLSLEPRPKNDLVILLSDGEEAGLLGAKAFLQQHPLARNIGLAVNFDARGTGGPSLMFETSPGNGRLVRELFKSCPGVLTSSMMHEVYRRLPNATDFSLFRDAGIPGFNFAMVQGLACYHTPLDDLGHLDQRTLQQIGYQTLALCRHFGSLPLADLKSHDTGFLGFPLLPNLAFGPSVDVALLLLSLGILGWLVVHDLRKRQVSPVGLGIGVLWVLLAMSLAAVLSRGTWELAHRVQRQGGNAWGDTPNGTWFLVAFAGWAVLGTVWLQWVLGKRSGHHALRLGCLLAWGFLAVFLCIRAPGAGFMFTWPLLGVTLGCWALTVARMPPWARSLVRGVALLPLVLLWGPCLLLLLTTLGVQTSSMAVCLVSLTLALALTTLEPGRKALPWLLGSGLALAFTGLAGAAITCRWDSDHPVMFSLIHVQDADRRTAFWAADGPGSSSGTFSPTPSTGMVDSAFPFKLLGPMKIIPAEHAGLAAPDLDVVQDSPQGGSRRLVLRLVPKRKGSLMFLIEGVTPRFLSVDAVPLEPSPDPTQVKAITVLVHNPSSLGSEFVIDLPAGSRLTGRLCEQVSGWVTMPLPPPFLRSPGFHTGPMGDAVVVVRRVEL